MVRNRAKCYQWWMIVVILMLFGTRGRDAAWPAESPNSAAAKARAIQMLKASPAVFIENQGQWDEPAVRFALTSPAANAGLTSTSIRFQLFKREPLEAAPASSALQPPPRPGAKAGAGFRTQMHAFETVLEGARPVAPAGLAASAQRFNYRRGEQSKWRENVPAWESVRYAGIYPGIDLIVAGRAGGIKYEFHAAPGADLKKIALRYQGLAGLKLREDGGLELTPAAGWTPLVDGAPVIYQEADGARKPVAGRFRLIAPNTVGFELTGSCDPARPLVIDPDVAWSSYLGGSGSDAANAVAVDPAGNILVTGNSYSANWLTGGGKTSVDTNYGDAFVAKFTSTGEPLWSTCLGSGSYDSGAGIAADRLGSIYVCGYTNYYSPSWLSGGFKTTPGGSYDGFLVRLSPTGQMIWGTYLGGSGDDRAYGVAVDPAGNAYVTGATASSGWLTGGYDTTYHGGNDAFVAKVTSAGQLAWGTYLGGSAIDYCYGIALDGAGAVYATGSTASSGWVAGGFDTTFNSYSSSYLDAFVVKLTTDGAHLWSTYLGGLYDDYGCGVAVDGTGCVAVCGNTSSAGWVAGGFNTTYASPGTLGFVARLTPAGGLLWSSYLGGKPGDTARAVTADAAGNLWVAGSTWDPSWLKGGALPPAGGSMDAYVARLSPSGQLLWAQTLGGTSYEYAYGLAQGTANDLIVAGTTQSTGWTAGGYDLTYGGSTDGFVARILHADQPLSGTLTVTLAPPAAVAAGAKWRRVGTADWLDSGDAEASVPIGTQVVEFRPAATWVTPTTQTLTVRTGQTTSTQAVYAMGGALGVTITPPEAVAAGARWRRVGTSAWLGAGTTETELAPGTYSVEFKPLADWCTPLAQAVTIRDDQTTTVAAAYTIPQAELSWSSYVGGSGLDNAQAVTVDHAGNVYIAGYTDSSGWVQGGYDTSNSGSETDGFLVKFNSAGQHLWSTYLGAYPAEDKVCGVAVDSADNVYAVGYTGNAGWLTGGFSSTYSGGADGFIIKFSPKGNYLWGSYLGGAQWDEADAIAIDASDTIYVAGKTQSPGWVRGGFKTVLNGTSSTTYSDVFVARIPASGAAVTWSSYLGGSSTESARGLAVDTAGNICVTGMTYTADWIAGGGNATYGGLGDAFVAKLSPAGALLWSTLLGGNKLDEGYGIATDAANNIYVTGATASAGWVVGGFNTTQPQPGFAVKLSPAGQHLWSTFIDGTGRAVALGAAGDVYLTGYTYSSNLFPGGFADHLTVTANPDAFVLKLTGAGQYLWGSVIGGDYDDLGYGIALGRGHDLYVVGSTESAFWAAGGYHTIFNSWGTGFIAQIHDLPTTAPRGALSVALAPPEAVAAGAQWHRTDRVAWRDPGLEENLAAGTTYTLTFKAPTGWTSPPDQVVRITDGQTTAVLATYIRQTGSLKVTLSPPEAVVSGGKWRRVGTTPWLDSAATETGVPTGSCQVEFLDVAGWGTPALLSITVSTGSVASGSATYKNPLTGSLQVTINPAAAGAAGARWRRVGATSWLSSGSTDSSIVVGTYPIEFKPLSGWTTPPNQNVTIAYAATTTASAAYVRQTGAIAVRIDPPAALADGARWRRTGTIPWLDSGTTETAIPTGGATIEFKTLTDWVTPANQTVTVRDSQTTSVAALYGLPQPGLGTARGAVAVTLQPSDAVASGAQWRPYGTTAWRDSDSTVTNIPVGPCGVEFKPIAQWTAPTSMTVAIADAQTTHVSAAYALQTGALAVTITPPLAIPAGAQWRRLGTTAWRNGGTTETGLLPASYLIEFKPVATWGTPAVQSVTVAATKTTTAMAAYVSPTGSLKVNIAPSTVQASGQWRRSGTTTWLSAGTQSGIPIGNYDVEFKPVTSWDTPAPVNVNVLYNTTTVTTGTYVLQTGSLCVTINPPEAVAAGAKWRWGNSTRWYDSGTTATGVPARPLIPTVMFSTARGWLPPPVAWAAVQKDQTTLLQATYTAPTQAELSWSTYLGSTASDECAAGVAIDGAGNLYAGGWIGNADWIAGGADATFNGGADAYVAKFAPGGAPLWSTFLGGTGDDHATGIALDKGGNILVCGDTSSTSWTRGGYQTNSAGAIDAFAAKLTPDGAFLWSTYLGGTSHDYAAAIAADPAGNLFVAGRTYSPGWVSGAATTSTFTGSVDAFVVKLSPAGQHQWSTYLGSNDNALGVAADSAGNVCVSGVLWQSGWIAGGYDTQYGGGNDGFVAKLSPVGQILWGTYLGGSGDDTADAVAVDGDDNIIATGRTASAGWVAGGFKTAFAGSTKGYAVKLSPAGKHLWSSYLGGTGADTAYGIAIDPASNIYVTGDTDSTATLAGGYDPNLVASIEAYVCALSPSGQRYWTSSLGVGFTYGRAIAAGARGELAAAGKSYSPGWTMGGFDTTFHGGTYDGFLARITQHNLLMGTASPPAAATAGAQWRRVGTTPWFNSGSWEQVADTTATFTIEFKPLAGWQTPPNQTVTLGAGRTREAAGAYVELKGDLLVTIAPPEAALSARWRRVGTTAWLAGGTTETGVQTGDTTVEFQPLAGWTTPPNQAVHIDTGLLTKAAGSYGSFLPGTPLWSTYLGGTASDDARGIALDADGNCYVTGYTNSAGWVSGGANTTQSGGSDIFVAKLSPSGQHLWSTYFGGGGGDGANAIAADGAGNCFVTGWTASSGWIQGGAKYHGGSADAFLLKLSPTGQHLWSTCLGGVDVDKGNSVALDGGGNIFVGGSTSSTGWTNVGYDTAYGGTGDGFVVKCSPQGQVLWSTYLGGAHSDDVHGLAVNSKGQVFAVGNTTSNGWVSGGVKTVLTDTADAFLVGLSASGAHLWSTYLGGGGAENGNAIAIDRADNIFAIGYTASDGWISGNYKNHLDGSGNGFVVKFSPLGQPLWSTYLGGTDSDNSYGAAVDRAGNLYVTGYTYYYSDSWLTGGYRTTAARGSEAYAVKISSAGQFLWGTFLGGTSSDYGYAIAVNDTGQIFVAGETASAGWTAGGYDTTLAGDYDGFAVKLNEGPNPSPGTLRVTITPPVVAAAGARWRIAGTTTWYASDDVVNVALEQVMEIEFNPVANWIMPAKISVGVHGGVPVAVNAAYQARLDLALHSPALINARPGERVSLVVTVGGLTPIAVQWKKDGTAIPGATSTTLTLAPCQVTDAGLYTCGAGNGYSTAETSAVRLSVNSGNGVINYLLGLTTDRTGLDLDGDGKITIADAVKGIRATPAAIPAGPTPGDGATGVATRPRLDWSDALRARSYDLSLWPAASAEPAKPSRAGLSVSQWDTTGTLAGNTKFQWRVTARGADGTVTTKGPVWSFTTGVSP